MTFSILARDPSDGSFGGAAATGSLCVGGWVLRGDSQVGLSASQGASPSTLWGEEALARMRDGEASEMAVAEVSQADRGRAWRQLSAIGGEGVGAAFTGERNTPWRGSLIAPNVVAAGNMLAGPEVLDAILTAFRSAEGPLADRLLVALGAGEAAGGDVRGLQSAALLVVSDASAPLTLRIDWSEAPIVALGELLSRTRDPGYASWFRTVPTRDDPERGHD